MGRPGVRRTGQQLAVGRIRPTARRAAPVPPSWQAVLDHLPGIALAHVEGSGRQHAVSGAANRVQPWQFAARLLPDGRAAAPAALLEAVAKGRAGQGSTVELIDPEERTTVRVTVVPTPERAAGAVLLVARDTTGQHHAARESERARRYADRLFQEAPHGKLLIAADGTIRLVNPALTGMIAWDAVQLVGTPLDQTPLAGIISVAELTELAAGSRRQVSRDGVVELAQGDVVHVSMRAVNVPDPDGDFGPAVLLSVIDVTERRKLEQQLAHLADHDPLTGLANRRRFDTELAAHLDRCRRYGADGAVIMLDLDHFKRVNDTLGHNAGDELILSVGSLLRGRMRTTDVVARLGGDEFAILVPVADRISATTIASGLVELIRTSATVLDGTRPHAVTASVGVVLVRDAQTSPHELLASADMTMYDAKDAGRDTFVVHDPLEFSQPRTGAQLVWATKVENALANDGFEVHAQPIADVLTGELRAAELLIRLVDDDGELVLPGRFLYVAERTSLILAVDEYMVRRAVELLAQLKSTHPQFRVSVNISGRSVGSPALGRLVGDLIAEHGVDPANLVLELTETAAVASLDAARTFVDRLHEIGCLLALDDFGAGFGSFYYLKHLTFDYLKIDGEFVSHIADNAADRLIVSSIVEIARGLGKTTVAEFVKDRRTLATVEALGVDMAQGYHIGRPVRLDALLRRIDRRPVLGGPRRNTVVGGG